MRAVTSCTRPLDRLKKQMAGQPSDRPFVPACLVRTRLVRLREALGRTPLPVSDDLP